MHFVFSLSTILNTFVDIPEQRLNGSCRYWSTPQVLCHPADSHSSDECQRYDFPALYWDCLAPLSFPIHPQENPNVLIPRGNIFFFVFTICLAMIYWLLLPPSQRLLILFGKSDFHTFRECVRGTGLQRQREGKHFEEQLCLNLYGVTPLPPTIYVRQITPVSYRHFT